MSQDQIAVLEALADLTYSLPLPEPKDEA